MSIQFFIKLVGTGSRAHIVEDEVIIMFLTSSWVVGCKMVSRVVGSGELREESCMLSMGLDIIKILSRFSRIFLTLFKKKFSMLS